jgi:hypothetical protein
VLGSQKSEKIPRKSKFQANSVNQGEYDERKRQSFKSKNQKHDVEKGQRMRKDQDKA